ncbi:MAG: hypothetical protein WCQ41_06355 [Bacillota bacterium]
MDKGTKNRIEEIVIDRVNHHSLKNSSRTSSKVNELFDCIEKLRETLTPEQELLYHKCENALMEANANALQHYYRAGFFDAVRFFKDWGGEVD